MALIDDIKLVLRVSSNAFDAEVDMLIKAAFADLRRVGVRPELLDEDDPDDAVKMCVALYAKQQFGFDNSEADRLGKSYDRAVVDLLNSQANIAASYDEVP